MIPTSRAAAAHYVWGDGCDGWRLQDSADLSVIEEVMPPGASELRHQHGRANQVFYVLDGVLTLACAHDVFALRAGEALNVMPRIAHQVRNDSDRAVRFLVISAPSTRDDRQISGAAGHSSKG